MKGLKVLFLRKKLAILANAKYGSSTTIESPLCKSTSSCFKITILALVFFKSLINFRSEKKVIDYLFDDLSDEKLSITIFLFEHFPSIISDNFPEVISSIV